MSAILGRLLAWVSTPRLICAKAINGTLNSLAVGVVVEQGDREVLRLLV